MKSLLLPPLSALYGAITKTRASLYQRGTFKTARLHRPVISVGNITTGGTGKTPMVEWVARVVASSGRKVCILTRGYRRENPGQRVLVSDGATLSATPAEAGDEPFLLAKNLIGVAAVISDADREAAGLGAIKHLGTECFVLDDGFQHLRLARDLNIVMIDATNPWGGGSLLPYGRLREPLEGLKRADCVVVTRSDQVNELEPLIKELARLTGDRPVFRSRMETVGFASLNETAQSSQLPTSLAAFCALGNPPAFYEQVRRSGINLTLEKSYTDHHSYNQADIDTLVQAAKQSGAEGLITSAKDAVKLGNLETPIPCFVLEIEMKIENEAELKRMIIDASKSEVYRQP
jgi:tetraacyldisaccharide 4'-kinase